MEIGVTDTDNILGKLGPGRKKGNCPVCRALRLQTQHAKATAAYRPAQCVHSTDEKPEAWSGMGVCVCARTRATCPGY